MRIRNFDEIENLNESSDWEVINSFYRFGGFNERLNEVIPLEKLLRSDEEIDKIIYNKLENLNK